MQPGRVPKAQRGGGRNSESSVPPPTEPGVLRPAIIKSESSRGRCWEGGRWKDYFKKSLENLFEEKMDLLPPPAGPEIPPPAVTPSTRRLPRWRRSSPPRIRHRSAVRGSMRGITAGRRTAAHRSRASTSGSPCTLREDLLVEVSKFAREGRFDYLFVESSGTSEPLPVPEPRL